MFHSGFLKKRGRYGIAAKWKERYIVLKGSKLWYYPQSAKLTDMPRGVIDLRGAGVQVRLAKRRLALATPARL